jgi:hypothetical protein
MKKLFTLLLIGTAGFSFAQKVVALSSGGNTQMFQGLNPFIDAYAAATTGDTIYLPGGTVTAPSIFDKAVYIIGAGYHPDSSITTIKTTVSGQIILIPGASQSFFQGIEFFGTITMDNNAIISSVSFSRCKFNNTINFPGTNGAQLFSFNECIFMTTVTVSNMVSSTINNCILQGMLVQSKNNNIANNVFLFQTSSPWEPVLYQCNNNTITNNVFLFSASDHLTSIYYPSQGNTYINNLFVRSNPEYGNDATTIGNYTGIDATTIFVNQTGFVFNFAHNYALQNPQNFPGYNTDQVGLFGGMMPWKIGGIPINPHYQSKFISSTTDNNGMLQIEITVEAQDE